MGAALVVVVVVFCVIVLAFLVVEEEAGTVGMAEGVTDVHVEPAVVEVRGGCALGFQTYLGFLTAKTGRERKEKRER